MNKRIGISAAILGVSAIIGAVIYISNPSGNSSMVSGIDRSQAFVGGDLHTLTALGNQLYVTGHEAAGVSSDGGENWRSIPSLNYTDIMGWAKTSTELLVGGHPGLYKSSDGGVTFRKISFYGNVSDVHSIGAAGETIYLGSPEVGLLASDDGGKTWKMRNKEIGQGFMGSMLVDPTNPQRVIAPDMQAGLVISTDGGVTWRKMGGPSGAMSVTWNPTNMEEIAAVGMNGGGISNDGGRTWQQLSLLQGSSALAYSSDGKKLYVATLVGTNAQIFTSTDAGMKWVMASGVTKNPSDVPTMDPNMPGMDHNTTVETTSKRPIKAVIGIFGFGTVAILLGANYLRRKDLARNLAKANTRAGKR